ncbi:MAG: hypothetical protein A2Y25_02635 [Candidatus Melainabacteria bacterium GWF2_37_15]|nr:MAG: hypothetical protein A2Y25_02635 [Candidatus Melainabacteria bacterium GWF2_37_15]
MDLLPIKPASTNKVDSAINLANDGGSKSNTGYFSNRGQGEEKPPEKLDEVTFSHAAHPEAESIDEEKKLMQTIQSYFNKAKDFILKLFGIKKKKIYNIYEKL